MPAEDDARSSSFHQLDDVVDAVDDVALRHAPYGLLYHGPVAILDNAGQLSSSESAELLLHLGEDELDRIVLWAVGHVEDAPEPEHGHLRLGLLALVSCEVVHEQGDLLLAILISQLL